MGGTWLRLTGEEFLEDGAISVSVKPQPLYIHTRNGQHKCSGEYVPLTDRTANGYPIWEHVGSRCWLYSGSTVALLGRVERRHQRHVDHRRHRCGG